MIKIILAAGRGNRLKKTVPNDFNYITKSLIPFGEESAITRLINQVNILNNDLTFLVIGHKYKDVIKNIDKSNINQDNLNLVINHNYLKDSNLKSLFLAIETIFKLKDGNLNEGILIIEADSFFNIEKLKDFNIHLKNTKDCKTNKKEICWTSKGKANLNQIGGFLDPSIINSNINYGNISNAYISKIRNHNYSLKMYGITWMNHLALRSWHDEVQKLIKEKSNLNKLYFHDLIFKNKDEYFMSYYDFGENVHSFNNYDEYIECLKFSN